MTTETPVEGDNQDSTAIVAAGNLMESRTSHLDDLLNERLEAAFHSQTNDVHVHELAKIASEFSAIDLAYAVCRLPPACRPLLYDNLPDWASKIEFFINTDGSTRASIYRSLTDEEIRRLIERMPPDEAVWVLDNLPDRRLRRLLEAMDPKKAANIRELQKHDRHSAARMMTNEFFAFPMEVTIGEAAAYIRNHPGIDLTRRIFVLNQTGELVGQVPARNFIVNPHHLQLKMVMRPIVHKVPPETSRDEVVDLVERYKIPALPVTDGKDFLVGVITYEDVVEAIEDMADETIAQMAGTGEDVSAHEPTIKRFFARAPWLIVTLCGGLINAASMAYFESTLSTWLAFAVFFVPLITGMSGNVGVQCSTVLVRGMATGLVSSGSKGEAVSAELSIGLLIGLVFGIVGGLVVYFLNAVGLQQMSVNSIAVGVTVSCGLFGACLTATVLGVFSPLFFARVGIDPAISSGPIITAFNDVFSMIMYFLIAQVINTFFFPV
jgi:magnesium transporter